MTPKLTKLVETEEYVLFKSNSDIFSFRKDDRFLSEPLNENKEVANMVEYLNEFENNEVNDVLNKITNYHE